MTKPSTFKKRDTALVCLVIVALLATKADLAQAQAGQFMVGISRPGEGEMFYAGPSVPRYNVPITGWVESRGVHLNEVNLRLEVFQGSRLVGSTETRPLDDGTFLFYVTANPGASDMSFPTGGYCGQDCHFPTGLRIEVSLPPGASILRVTARFPTGEKVFAERHVVVDRSAFATVPVQVVMADESGQVVAGVSVIGSTRLYMWRDRFGSATTAANGYADVSVESLAQAPSHYVFRVEPSVVEGVLYESEETVTVTLPPAATSAPPITLKVHKHTGQITGRLSGTETAILSVPVRAIHLPDGVSHRAQTSPQGTFAFSDLPIGKYLIVIESDAHGPTGDLKTVDLELSPSISITLPVQILDKPTLHGEFSDDVGMPVPFVWATFDQSGTTRALMPGINDLVLPSSASLPITISLTAPGFFSQQQIITPTAGTTEMLAATLIRRPETRTLPWGSGQVIIPPEAQVAIENQQITLTHGWLWGRGDGQTIALRTPEGQLSIPGGIFALERVSGDAAWLYLMQGEATANGSFGAPVPIHAGEMIALVNGVVPHPVPIDPVVVAALHLSTELPIIPIWQPTGEEVTRTQITQTSITAAQVVTFVVYSLAVLSLIIVPLAVLSWWMRHRKKQTRSSN